MRAKSSLRHSIDFHHSCFTQVGESYCGPAVIQMLLHNLGIEVTQEAVAEAGGASNRNDQHGMRVDQLARAVGQLAPQTIFWYKDHATIEELARVVTDYRYPVGVEWQSLLEDTIENETQDGNYGHYSVVTITDSKSAKVVIVDPHKDYRSQDRILPFEFFISRWWDTNEIPDLLSGKNRLVEDRQMMFMITPEEETFPQLLNMARG